MHHAHGVPAPVCMQSDGRQFVSALVDVDPAHSKAGYEAKGLQPGNKYYISVTGK